MRVAVEDSAGNVARQVPGTGGLLGLGNVQGDFRQVADVVCVPGVNGQNDRVALLEFQGLSRRRRLASEIDGTLGEHSRSIPPAMLQPPRDTVTTGRVSMCHL